MKISNSCARKVLLEVESIPYGETITVAKLHENLSNFSIGEVISIVTLFNKGNYIIVTDKISYDDNDVLRDNKIKGLTEKGYKTLDLIRNDTTWNNIKEKLPNFDDLSIYTIFDLANKISNTKQNNLFDLPKDLMIYTTRW